MSRSIRITVAVLALIALAVPLGGRIGSAGPSRFSRCSLSTAMKRITRGVMTGVVLLGVAIPAAAAKEKVSARLCGSARCVELDGLEARVTHRYAWVAAPKPTAFYTVRMITPPLIPGLRGRIIYVPGKGVWRVKMQDVYVWLDVPFMNEPALRRAARTLRPCAPSTTWTCVRNP